jgi:DNA-binding beta-propeller fold protein YncE
VVDGDGNVIEVWDQWDYLFEGTEGPGPHRIRISPYDPERRVWVVHETGHQIFVFSNDGSALRTTLGEKNVGGSDRTHFGQPQDVAFLPDGRVLVADGYVNSRVVVLDSDGKYLEEFGEPGDGPGQFDVVHGLALARGGRILVADRDNRRIQVFRESDFSYVAEWPTVGLALDIIVSGSDVWVSDLQPAKVTKFDLDGNRLYTWNLPSEGPTAFREMHSFAVDSAGNLYGSDNQHGRTQKFVPKADAPPAQLIGERYVP